MEVECKTFRQDSAKRIGRGAFPSGREHRIDAGVSQIRPRVCIAAILHAVHGAVVATSRCATRVRPCTAGSGRLTSARSAHCQPTIESAICGALPPRGRRRFSATDRGVVTRIPAPDQLMQAFKHGGQLALAGPLWTRPGRYCSTPGRAAARVGDRRAFHTRANAAGGSGFNQAHEIARRVAATRRSPRVVPSAWRVRDAAPQARAVARRTRPQHEERVRRQLARSPAAPYCDCRRRDGDRRHRRRRGGPRQCGARS